MRHSFFYSVGREKNKKWLQHTEVREENIVVEYRFCSKCYAGRITYVFNAHNFTGIVLILYAKTGLFLTFAGPRAGVQMEAHLPTINKSRYLNVINETSKLIKSTLFSCLDKLRGSKRRLTVVSM